MPSQGGSAAYYNKHVRNEKSRQFYNSAAWRGPSGARTAFIREHPTCERCQKVVAEHVHHKIPIDTPEGWERRFDPSGFMAVCLPCHNWLEARIEKQEPTTATGTLQPIEDEEFYYDPDAAEKPIKFIAKFCRHYEGKWAGKSFDLLHWQQQLIRTLFGWKRRADHLRRFRELYLISAKGAGKTPLLAAIGLYLLLGDGEAGAHVISMASSFEQANLTFDAGKKYINEHPQLRDHPQIDPKQYVIDAPKYSKWGIVSGKPNGRSGARPSAILASEIHEWPAATAHAFDMLCANLFKRSQPLLLIDTNAAADRNSFAWKLHERATAVLAGTTEDKALLPVIFESPKSLDWKSEDAARAANPSIPAIVSFDAIKPEQAKGEARYRRLYLSQWVTASDKWLDMDVVRRASQPLDRQAVEGAARYVGLDLSNGDDLCAMTDVFVTAPKFHTDCRFWLPRQTAEKYEAKDLHPYSEWDEQKAITLLDERTISIDVQQRIAATIIESHKSHPIAAVCYDRAYQGGVIELLKAAGIECRPVAQGYTVSAGCEELDRRLQEQSIALPINPVAQFCCSNVEITTNQHGQYWPIKPNAKGKYAGKRASKIDFVSALVTALTEARRHQFAQTAHVGAEAFSLD
ncbi:MAG TPA: terminase TerL endonuclease subunit [Tepidisphaeraceae bacterium]|jgi:phage terminase large subunit-like protein|nr:terminase TerL endonuclease subunit [Tepidisphaeraceae bacterium]